MVQLSSAHYIFGFSPISSARSRRVCWFPDRLGQFNIYIVYVWSCHFKISIHNETFFYTHHFCSKQILNLQSWGVWVDRVGSLGAHCVELF